MHNNAIVHQPSKLGLDLRYGAARLHYGRTLRRYGSIMKFTITLLTIFLLSCSSTGNNFAKVERECLFDQAQKLRAWSNIVTHVKSEYPRHAEFCDLNRSYSDRSFNVVDGECRIYLGCSNQVSNEVLSHGDMLVVINEETQEVIKAYGVKW